VQILKIIQNLKLFTFSKKWISKKCSDFKNCLFLKNKQKQKQNIWKHKNKKRRDSGGPARFESLVIELKKCEINQIISPIYTIDTGGKKTFNPDL
jgi:hypothetical protein